MKKAGFKNQNASLKVVQFANNVEDMEQRAAIVGRGRTPAAQAALVHGLGQQAIAGNKEFLGSQTGQERIAVGELGGARAARGEEMANLAIAMTPPRHG